MLYSRVPQMFQMWFFQIGNILGHFPKYFQFSSVHFGKFREYYSGFYTLIGTLILLAPFTQYQQSMQKLSIKILIYLESEDEEEMDEEFLDEDNEDDD